MNVYLMNQMKIDLEGLAGRSDENGLRGDSVRLAGRFADGFLRNWYVHQSPAPAQCESRK